MLDGLIMLYRMTENRVKSSFLQKKINFFCGKVGTGRAAAGVPIFSPAKGGLFLGGGY